MFQREFLEKIRTRIFFNSPPPPENHVFYEIMWKDITEPGRPQMPIWRMHIACCVIKATNAHSEYVLHFNNGCMNAPQCYVVCALPVLLNVKPGGT
jgi:hypothetical protein